MRENGLLAPHRLGRTEAKPHDGTIITDKVNEMWGTDMTQTITIREGRAECLRCRGTRRTGKSSAFMHRGRPIASRPASRCARLCIAASGAIAPGVVHRVKTRNDHGSNYMSGDFQDEIEYLGSKLCPPSCESQRATASQSAYCRTLKENLLWVITFYRIRRAGEPRSSSSPGVTTKPGWSPWTAIVLQTRCDASQCRFDQNATANLKLAA